VRPGGAKVLRRAPGRARGGVGGLGFSPGVGQIVAGSAAFSERTRAIIDSEIERMVADAYSDAVAVLPEHRDALDRLREQLVRRRELERVDILAAIRQPRPVLQPTPAATPDELPLAPRASRATSAERRPA